MMLYLLAEKASEKHNQPYHLFATKLEDRCSCSRYSNEDRCSCSRYSKEAKASCTYRHYFLMSAAPTDTFLKNIQSLVQLAAAVKIELLLISNNTDRQ